MKKLGILWIILSTFLVSGLLAPMKTDARADVSWAKLSTDVPLSTSASAAYPRMLINNSNLEFWTENAPGDLRHFAITPTDSSAWGNPAAWIPVAVPGAHEPFIMLEGGTYKMWYNKTPSTAYRTSADGVNWSAETLCTFDVTKAWDGDRITPMIIKDGNTYKMYYNANEGNGSYYIAYATSTNGTSWVEPQNLDKVVDKSGSKNNNLVLKQGGVGEWDGYQAGEALYSSYVVKNSYGSYEMWYSGTNNASTYKIGYASSSDGISWSRYAYNPVLTGTDGKWDGTGIFYPSVFEMSGPLTQAPAVSALIMKYGAEIASSALTPGDIDQNSYYFMIYTKADWSGSIGVALANRIAEQRAEAAASTESLPETGSNISTAWLFIVPIAMVGLVSVRLYRYYQKRN